MSDTRLRDHLKLEYSSLLKSEETSWREKSHIAWLKEEDKNTHFFHKAVNSRRRYNFINRLNVNGIWLESEDEIKEASIAFYQNLYQENTFYIPKLDGLSFFVHSDAQREALETPFMNQEILNAMKNMKADNALGPDGFSIQFFKACWDIVGPDFVNWIKEFHESGTFDRALNCSFISLIPKSFGATELRDFRLISLLGSVT